MMLFEIIPPVQAQHRFPALPFFFRLHGCAAVALLELFHIKQEILLGQPVAFL
ncbi:hypothetical protein D3C84_1235470 [compost metagenome]